MRRFSPLCHDAAAWPRRTNVLFATNALFAAIFGWVFLGEALAGQTLLAILFGFAGVVLAVIYGKRRDLMHRWESSVMPPLWLGVCLGIAAAVCQALGVIFIRPAMAAGVDPVAATLARAIVGAVVFWMTMPFDRGWRGRPLVPASGLLLLIGLNGLFGLGVGAAFLLAALETGNVATVTILASTTPVLILPFIWRAYAHETGGRRLDRRVPCRDLHSPAGGVIPATGSLCCGFHAIFGPDSHFTCRHHCS